MAPLSCPPSTHAAMGLVLSAGQTLNHTIHAPGVQSALPPPHMQPGGDGWTRRRSCLEPVHLSFPFSTVVEGMGAPCPLTDMSSVQCQCM
jgi:hypothetical protein